MWTGLVGEGVGEGLDGSQVMPGTMTISGLDGGGSGRPKKSWGISVKECAMLASCATPASMMIVPVPIVGESLMLWAITLTASLCLRMCSPFMSGCVQAEKVCVLESSCPHRVQGKALSLGGVG